MARRALSPEQVQRFRERATMAATRLFARHGFDGVTMRSLAEELGCAVMTPYRYFSDKDELFAAVRASAFRRFGDRQAAAAARPGSARERLRRIARAYVAFALAEPDRYRIMFELRQAPAGVHPELDLEVRRAFSYLHGTMKDLVARGEERARPLTLALLAWAQVHGLVSLYLAGKLEIGRRALEGLVAAALEYGAGRRRRR